MSEDWDDGPYEPTKEERLMEDCPEGVYRVYNSDDSIASEGRVHRSPDGTWRFDPPPMVGPKQRLRF